jgi:hypothetical protein
MTQTQNNWPPPQPPLTWPRLRGWLATFFTWADRRKKRQLDAAWILAQDAAWRAQYAEWWMEHGWQQGADTPDVAWTKLRATRR